jgi:hypothetical protein
MIQQAFRLWSMKLTQLIRYTIFIPLLVTHSAALWESYFHKSTWQESHDNFFTISGNCYSKDKTKQFQAEVTKFLKNTKKPTGVKK